jgi:pimeloyl-ACP methyl ester carboxylesterase
MTVIVRFVNMNMTATRFTHLPAAGVRLHVAQAGQGSPVLLLHGFPDHWRLWQPLMGALAPAHRMMAPDLRGINLSDKPPAVTDYDIAHLVDDVLALIDHLGGRCALVGHDWGGLLAWTVAALHPQRVSRLAVFNAPHPCRFAQQLKSSPQQREASAYAMRLRQPGVEQHLADKDFELLWAVRSDNRRGPAWDAERRACVQAWSQPGALTAAVNWYRALNIEAALGPQGVASVPDLGGASGVVNVPTLVVWGERDGSFPAACLDGLEQWVPDLLVHRQADGGHWLLEEQPALAAALLADFLAVEA